MKFDMFSQKKTTKLVYVVGTILQTVCFIIPFSLVYWALTNPMIPKSDVAGMAKTFFICYPILIIGTSIYLWLQMDKIPEENNGTK